jgi:hypothetical protein
VLPLLKPVIAIILVVRLADLPHLRRRVRV